MIGYEETKVYRKATWYILNERSKQETAGRVIGRAIARYRNQSYKVIPVGIFYNKNVRGFRLINVSNRIDEWLKKFLTEIIEENIFVR